MTRSKVKPSAESSVRTSATLILCSMRIGTDRILLAILEQHQTPVWLDRAPEALEHRLRLRELVIDVDHDHEIDGRLRQACVALRALDGFDVRDVPRAQLVAQRLQHRRLQIVRVDLAARPDPLRQPHGHVAAPGADIRDHQSRRDADQIERALGLFFDLTLAAIEPLRVGRDPGNAATGQRMGRRLPALR